MTIKKELLVYGLAILLVASVFGTAIGTGAWVEENDVGDAYLSSGRVADNPIEIYDWYGLNEVRNDLDGDYVLMNDLDEDTDGYDELVDTENGWEPIGDWSWDEDVEFRGTFDGNGFEIRNLYINRPDRLHVGFFGATYDGAEITNLGVVDAYVRGDYSVGGLVGFNWADGTVSNSYAIGDVSGGDEVGGLVGWNEGGSISNSYATGIVSGDRRVGGLVGYNYGTIENSYATGDVNGEEYVGGLVGENTGTVSDSYATGQVNGEYDVGGLVGINLDGTVSNSYATGDVSGDYDVGGLVGYNRGTVENSYATGNVDGHVSVGGLVGINDDTIENSFYHEDMPECDEEGFGSLPLSDEEFGSISTFESAGWDIEMVETDRDKPFLSWEEGDADTTWYIKETEQTHDLTINIKGEGDTDPSEGTHTFYEHGKIVIEAIPGEGWEFVEWTGDYESEEKEITITMDEDKEITAHFEEEEEGDIIDRIREIPDIIDRIREIPGFTMIVLLIAAVIAVAIYRKKQK